MTMGGETRGGQPNGDAMDDGCSLSGSIRETSNITARYGALCEVLGSGRNPTISYLPNLLTPASAEMHLVPARSTHALVLCLTAECIEHWATFKHPSIS